MKENALNIALITESKDRQLQFQLYLKSSPWIIKSFNLESGLKHEIRSEPYDLIIFDTPSFKTYNIKELLSVRNEKLTKTTSILFLLTDTVASTKKEIFEDDHSSILIDPFDKFEFLTAIQNLTKISQLEKRLFIYTDMLESEKQLIFYLEEILQLSNFAMAEDLAWFFHELEFGLVKRIELTFAAETAIFLRFQADIRQLSMQVYSESGDEVIRRHVFDIDKSDLAKAINGNSIFLFEQQKLLDPFVQELEETLGFEIQSLLFAPLKVLNKTRGGFVLINKIYRNSFSENDIAMVLTMVSKLSSYLEALYLRQLNIPDFDVLLEHGIEKPGNRLEIGLYRDILQSVTFGLLVFDVKYKIVFINEFARSILEVENDDLSSLENTLDRKSAQELISQIKADQLPSLRREVPILLSSGKNLYLGYSLYQLTTVKKEKRYVMTFMEISQTKKLQAEIIRMDRMASLGVLASGIAHEIRNPLAGIKAMAQTLEEELEGDNAKIEYAERIVRQVNRLDQLLRSFFTYARPARPNPIKCHIPDIVHEVLPLFKRKIKQNQITIKELYSSDLREVFVDAHQIEQVFFNLIINAIDAMESGGLLTIAAKLPDKTVPLIDRRQRIPKLFSDTYNEITISDTGMGMDESTIHSIYNPFFTTKPNGTGLGLSIVYQIIREHGGQIQVDSKAGEGTTFKILLPVYIAKPAEYPDESTD